MYTVTFYSYKGGVGRTMALMNVAYLLAREGKRVLVVDFDLEAPGLPSYLSTYPQSKEGGLVDYVHAYLKTGEAQNVSDFISQVTIGDAHAWFMSAGRHTSAAYSTLLNSIDWGDLYERNQGFLMMEDLKRQWANYGGLGFDYVLIDSRTGHTDIGGICTRQLPDAVVIMFVPTPQNVCGLVPITRVISQERAPVRDEPVRLHYVPSNVPDLDDEEEILSSLLESAKSQLGYKENAIVIQNYRSLDLLQHPVYTFAKPRTRLSRQYDQLKQSIAAANLSDRQGALASLAQMRDEYLAAREANDENALRRITARLSAISFNFPSDGELAFRLASLWNLMMRPEEEVSALSVAIKAEYKSDFALLQRARVRASLSERDLAVRDLKALLNEGPLTVFEVTPAIDLLRTLAPEDWKKIVISLVKKQSVDLSVKAHGLQRLLEKREDAEYVVRLARSALDNAKKGDDTSMLTTAYSLALISAGQPKEAMRFLARSRNDLIRSNSMTAIFNYAVAEWASTGVVPQDLFKRLLKLKTAGRITPDANMLQCFALSKAALGLTDEALKDLSSAAAMVEPEHYVFSCWRYLNLSGKEIQRDFNEMAKAVSSGKDPMPPFLKRNLRLKLEGAPASA